MPRKEKQTYTTEKKVFPVRLRALMRIYKVSQACLASAIGVQRQTISLYMTGQSNPDWEKLAAVASYFNVTADYLIGLESCSKRENAGVGARYGFSEAVLGNLDRIPAKFLPYLHDLLSSEMLTDLLYDLAQMDGLCTRGLQLLQQQSVGEALSSEDAEQMRSALRTLKQRYGTTLLDPVETADLVMERIRRQVSNFVAERYGFEALMQQVAANEQGSFVECDLFAEEDSYWTL